MSNVNLKAVVEEISDHLSVVDEENDVIKGLVDSVHLESGINKKVFKKVAVAYHKQKQEEVLMENDLFDKLFKEIAR